MESFGVGLYAEPNVYDLAFQCLYRIVGSLGTAAIVVRTGLHLVSAKFPES